MRRRIGQFERVEDVEFGVLFSSDAFRSIATVAGDIRRLSATWAAALLFLDVVCEFTKSLPRTLLDMLKANLYRYLASIQTRLSAARAAFAFVLRLAWWVAIERYEGITEGRQKFVY